MGSRRRTLILSDLRGGVNEHDPPTSIPRAQTLVNENIEPFIGGVGRKRLGASVVGSATDGDIQSLFRHVPDYDWNAELWTVCNAPGGSVGPPSFKYLSPAASGWTEIVPQNILDSYALATANAASFRGKLFVSAQLIDPTDRMQVWDGSVLRFAGLAAPTTAPVPSEGGGIPTGRTRTYKVTLLVKDGDVIDRRSEASPASASVVMTDDGVTVTRPSPLGTEHTHWELWAASDQSYYAEYRKIGEAPSTSESILDLNTALDGELIPDIGWNTPLPSAKFLAVDDGRLLMGSSRTDSDLGARIWFTPPVGSSDIGDDERIPITSELRNYVDVDRPSGSLTGLAASDVVYAFKSTAVYKLLRTGVASTPYRVLPVSREVGAINHKTIVVAEDAGGQPAVYFLSRRGPYRVSAVGLEYLGTDIESTWQTINLDQFGHGLHYHVKHQVWWWLPLLDGGKVLLTYDTRVGQRGPGGAVRGGWSINTGAASDCRSAVMFSQKALSPPWTPMSRLVPYAALGSSLVRFDADTAGYVDTYYPAGTGIAVSVPYESRLKTGALPLGDFGVKARVTGTDLVCSPDPSVSFKLRVSATKDFEPTGTDYVATVPASRSRERVLAPAKEPLSGGGPAGCEVAQFELTDDGGVRPWQVDALVVHYTMEEET